MQNLAVQHGSLGSRISCFADSEWEGADKLFFTYDHYLYTNKTQK